MSWCKCNLALDKAVCTIRVFYMITKVMYQNRQTFLGSSIVDGFLSMVDLL